MIEIALLVCLAFIYYLAQPVAVTKVVYIPQGSITKIITHLKEEKLPVSRLDRYMIRLFGQPQSGWIDLKTNYQTQGEFLYRLCHSKAAVKTVTLVPGETTHFFIKALSETFELDELKLREFYEERTPIKEGYFIPESYNIPIGIKEEYLIYILLEFAKSKHQELAEKLFGSYNESQWFRYLRIASVIQKEAANKEEMPLVASVIFNRLKKNMRLQMDGTLNYGIYSHQRVTPYRIRHDKTPYNTYKYRGIPPLPVCVVSSDAIIAAIKPSKTEYLYFFKNKKGTHDFTRYYSTHLKNIGNGKK